jgi:endonuclease/exonuclease/phosphatase family metal-dependent hydrolase
VTAPALTESPQLGEFIRIAQWNIERGLEYDALRAVFAGDQAFEAMLNPVRFPVGSDERRAIIEQARLLRVADVIVLNEVDWGLPRSGYRNIAAELAGTLGMHYAFGVEFVELMPVYFETNGTAEKAPGFAAPELDQELYKGLHGTAILSRFPLTNVRLIRFQHQPYDWFESEKKGFTFVEKAKQKLAKQVFLIETLREVRRGGRMMLLADINDTRFPAGKATIVATHLEHRSKPKGRQRQLAELLDVIREIRNPVIVCGDMNTSASDMTPTSIQRELEKRFGRPEALIKTGMNYALGLSLIENAAIASLQFGRSYADPTVRSIPILMPNDERKFFSMLKAFRFADGGSFDFRGEALRSSNGRRNTLANSNERDKKGFVTTFRLPRPIKMLGRHKLDWIFVKPAHLSDPSDYDASYVFAPHFGRTLGEINRLVVDRISDHSPLIVDLPLAEPAIEKRRAKGR